MTMFALRRSRNSGFRVAWHLARSAELSANITVCLAALLTLATIAATTFTRWPERSSRKAQRPSRVWVQAMYLMGSTRCGISAKQIQRETGVTYKTAWRMFRQIRTLLSEEITLEGSSVEMDETYFGGRRKGYRGRPGSGDKKKSPIVGIAERRGGKDRVIAKATKSVNADTLTGMVKEYVLPESTVFTDDFSGYDKIEKSRLHSSQNQSQR
jgi:transposase-like protein